MRVLIASIAILACATCTIAYSAAAGHITLRTSASTSLVQTACTGPNQPKSYVSKLATDVDGDGRNDTVFLYKTAHQWRIHIAATTAGVIDEPVLATSFKGLRLFIQRAVRMASARNALLPVMQASASNTALLRFYRVVGCALQPLHFAGLSTGNGVDLPIGGSVGGGFGIACNSARSRITIDHETTLWQKGMINVVESEFQITDAGARRLRDSGYKFPARNQVKFGQLQTLRC